jgi:PAS domain S-box-containing protein
VALVLGLTVAGFVVSRELADRSARHNSERRVELAAAQVRIRLEEATSVTESLRRFMLAEGVTGVTNDEFAKNALRWLFPIDLPAAAWAEEVPADERTAYERRIGEPIVSPGERRKAAPPRSSYLPATLVSGFPPMNLLGVDLKHEPGIATALRSAIVPGGVGATSVAARKDGTSGLFLVAPAPNLIKGVLRPGAVVLFVSEATLRSAARNAPGLRITDGGHSSRDHAGGHTVRQEFMVAGQQFAVDMPKESVSGPGRLLPWLILAAGLVLAPLAGALGVSAARRAKARADFDRIFMLSSDLIAVADLNGYFTRLNPAAERILGYTEDELLARPYLDFVHPDDRESTAAEITAIGAGKTTLSFENRYVRKDGSERVLEWTVTPVVEEGVLYGVARDVTERREAEGEVKRLADEQAALRRVATLVAEGTPPTEVLDAVAVEVGRLIGADLAVLSRYDQGGGVTVLSSRPDGTGRELPLTNLPTIDPESLTAAVLRTGRPARIDDFAEASGPWAAQSLELGYRSAVGAPVTVQGRLWGVMIVTSTDARRWPPDTEDRLAAFTELLATAIANTESRGELAASESRARELANEQAALRRVATLVAESASAEKLLSAVAEEVARVLAVPEVTIDRFDEDGSATTVLASWCTHTVWPVGSRWPLDGPSLAATIWKTGRPARIDDYTGLLGSIGTVLRDHPNVRGIGVPIVVGNRVWGMIGAGPLEDDAPEAVQERLARFTELVATAIANSESRAELSASEARARELANEQAALRRVATLVAESANAEKLLSTVAEEVARVLAVPVVTIDRFDQDGSATTVVASWHAEGNVKWPVGSRWPLDGPSVAATVWKTGRPAKTDDYTGLPGSIAAAFRGRPKARSIGVPIVVGNRVWGMIGAGSSEDDVPEAVDERLARFTELVATAIANSENRAELSASEARARALAEEQAALRRVATLVAQGATPYRVFDAVRDEVARMFEAPVSALYRFDADGMATVLARAGTDVGRVGGRWPLEGTSTAAVVHRTGRTARVDYDESARGALAKAAVSDGARQGVGAPIVVDGALWGSIMVASRNPEPLPAELEHRLAKFTELLGTAIANAENRADLAASEARARELANEQAALRRVATLVAQGASPDELFSAVAKEVAGVIEIPVVAINRYEADGTMTILGIVGETSLWIGTRWPAWGIAGTILATGRPSRQDDFTGMPAQFGDPVRDALAQSWQETRSVVGVPIIVAGSIWGFMSAAAKPGTLVPAGTEERLARFTELVATAVSNATTRTELLTSRARLVSAADETRRRLERDLHDGIQQWLVALALRARKAAGLVTAGESAVQELSGLADDLVAVTDELREISRGIHPAILSDAGLDDALESLARRSAIRVDLDVSFHGRYDPTLEATVYYVAAESITNAVKHAQASTVTVRGGQRDGSIELEIRDDGIGGADPRRGTGLIGLKDRVDTLGGTISFASQAGAGTTIRVKLPARPRDGEDPPLPRSDEAASAPASG